jgi:YD repeat-containing protein
LLSSETIAPYTNKSLTTTYEYDRFGNKTKSTTTGSGIVDGSSTTIKYSADGKFPIKTTNALVPLGRIVIIGVLGGFGKGVIIALGGY